MSQSQIKSSTIMFTDVFGYSKMVEKDEKHALNLLDKHIQIITKFIEEYKGSVIKFIGDAVFAEFTEPKEASHCAIQIQKNLIHRNKINVKNDRIHIRIGIHMGDLVVKGDDLFGNTVNLGSRIESVAPVDGIFISRPVYHSIQDDASFFTNEIGFVKLKNIKNPCQLYKLYLDQLNFTAQSPADLEKETLNRGVQVVDMNNYSPLDIYSIGILYFKNLGDLKDETVCRGIAQEIIKSMSEINALRIPSASEIDQYQDIDLPISEIARRMQVDHMLLGSIVKKEDTYTLNLEMKNITTDQHCFEETFTFHSTEFNTITGNILLKVLSQFDLELPEHVEKYFAVQSTSNPKAMDHYIKGRHLMEIPKSHDSLKTARDHFDHATKLDPAFLYAHTNKGWISFLDGDYDTAEEEFYSALDLARQDNLETSDAYVYGYMGTLYNRLEKYKKSIHYLEKALSIYLHYNKKRSIAYILHNLGHVLVETKKPTEALDCFTRSLAIKEEFEDRNLLASSYNQIANVYYTIGDHSLAIEHANRSLGYYNSLGNRLFGAYSMMVLADSLAQIGYFSESEKHFQSAENILEEFNNLFLLGKVDILRGIKYLNEGDIKQAIHFYEEGIDKMQLDASMHWIFQHTMELIHILIRDKDFAKASKQIKRSKLMQKKVQKAIPLEESKEEELLSIMEVYIAIYDDKEDGVELVPLYQSLQKKKDPSYLNFYYLGKAFDAMGKKTEKQECIIKAKDLLEMDANKISDSSHRDSFKTNHLFHQEIFS